MNRFLPTQGAKISDRSLQANQHEYGSGGRRHNSTEGFEFAAGSQQQHGGGSKATEGSARGSLTPRMTYAELLEQSSHHRQQGVQSSEFSRDSGGGSRLIPTAAFQPSSLEPSASAQLINATTKLDNAHLIEFAKIELGRLKDEGKIRSIQPLDDEHYNRGGGGVGGRNRPPLTSSWTHAANEAAASATAYLNPREKCECRLIVRCLSAQSVLFMEHTFGLLKSLKEPPPLLYLHSVSLLLLVVAHAPCSQIFTFALSALIDAFSTLSNVFPTIEEVLMLSKDHEAKSLFLQNIVNRAANRVADIAGASQPTPFSLSPGTFAAFIHILTKFVGDRKLETSYVAINGLRVIIKAYGGNGAKSESGNASGHGNGTEGHGKSSDNNDGDADRSSNAKMNGGNIIRPTVPHLSSLSEGLRASPHHRQQQQHQNRQTAPSLVNEAFFVAIPALLKRLSAQSTPKEMKRAICKTIILICQSKKINGLDVTIPFLGSSKFSLRHRLFVLKLLVKEFGVEQKGSVLNCPLVMTISLEALINNTTSTEGVKIRHAAVKLIVGTSLVVGKDRVCKYFRLKKIPLELQTYLESRMLEGEVRRRLFSSMRLAFLSSFSFPCRFSFSRHASEHAHTRTQHLAPA